MDHRNDFLAGARIEVLGVPVDAIDMDTTLQRVRDALAGNSTEVLLAVNPEKVMAAQQDPRLLEFLKSASLLVPDGIGVVIAARILYGVRMQRVAGADLLPEICGLAAEGGHGVFLYGAKDGIASRAAERLQERYPKLRVVGVQHGYVPSQEMDSLIRRINESGAAVLFVGLGSPRQELWVQRHRGRLNVRVCQCVGGSFDVISGNTRRAPMWLQKVHMEWLYRLLREPNRASRQTRLPKFVIETLREFLASRK